VRWGLRARQAARAAPTARPGARARDTEQIPLQEPGGIDAFIRREVLPQVPDAWIDESKTEIGYEISFNRYFYKPWGPPPGDRYSRSACMCRQSVAILKAAFIMVGVPGAYGRFVNYGARLAGTP
jgi:hypothetical protein